MLTGRQRIQIKDFWGEEGQGGRGEGAWQGYRARRGVGKGVRGIILIIDSL